MDGLESILQLIHAEIPFGFPLVMAAFGAIFGSFLTCMVYRVPREINLSLPPSYCPSCNKRLRAIDLIPIFSWIIFGGKCRMCKIPIPFRYIAIEIGLVVWGIVSLYLTPKLITLPLLFFAGVGFIFVALCWVMEKTFTPKVLLFSCMLFALFFYFSLYY